MPQNAVTLLKIENSLTFGILAAVNVENSPLILDGTVLGVGASGSTVCIFAFEAPLVTLLLCCALNLLLSLSREHKVEQKG